MAAQGKSTIFTDWAAQHEASDTCAPPGRKGPRNRHGHRQSAGDAGVAEVIQLLPGQQGVLTKVPLFGWVFEGKPKGHRHRRGLFGWLLKGNQ